MASSTVPSVVVSVKRHQPELVVPEKPIPHEIKELSDIDDQEGLHFHYPVIMFYHNSRGSMELTKDNPAKVIREALGKALVYYYPLAGRLIKGPNKKLMVDCSGQGVLFIEADANVTLDQLGHMILPRSPYLDQLLHDVPGSGGILGCPLLLIQVTRFTCGGFAFAIRVNHTMCDGVGLVQFLNAIGEFAGATTSTPVLSQPPVWERQILYARNPPIITCIHREYEDVFVDTINNGKMVNKSFFFGPKEISAIRSQLSPKDYKCTTFELLIACLWRCRTAALGLQPNEIVRLSCLFNARGKGFIDIPPGYYGNAFVYPAVVSNAKDLCDMPLSYAVEFVKLSKSQVSGEYVRSVADFLVIKGRPIYARDWNFIVSDNRRIGFDQVDFGWGKPIHGGVDGGTFLISFMVRVNDYKGEDGILVPMCLPLPAMERLQQELEKMTQLPIH